MVDFTHIFEYLCLMKHNLFKSVYGAHFGLHMFPNSSIRSGKHSLFEFLYENPIYSNILYHVVRSSLNKFRNFRFPNPIQSPNMKTIIELLLLTSK